MPSPRRLPRMPSQSSMRAKDAVCRRGRSRHQHRTPITSRPINVAALSRLVSTKHGHDEHHAAHGGRAHLDAVLARLFHADELADLEMPQHAQQGRPRSQSSRRRTWPGPGRRRCSAHERTSRTGDAVHAQPVRTFDQHTSSFVRLAFSHSTSGSISSNSMMASLFSRRGGGFRNDVGAFSQREQHVGDLRGAQTDHLMTAAFVGTEFEHVAQHRHLAPIQSRRAGSARRAWTRARHCTCRRATARRSRCAPPRVAVGYVPGFKPSRISCQFMPSTSPTAAARNAVWTE
jgi:hypothetical protein